MVSESSLFGSDVGKEADASTHIRRSASVTKEEVFPSETYVHITYVHKLG